MENEVKVGKFILPPPKEEPFPKITQRWIRKDGKEIVLAEVPHNCYAVIKPNPTCTGSLKVHFDKKSGSGIVKVPCWGCKKTDIEVSVVALRVGLRLL